MYGQDKEKGASRPKLSLGFDLGFGSGMNDYNYHNSSTSNNKNSSFNFAPQAWINIIPNITLVPAFDFGFSNYIDDDAAVKTTGEDEIFSPELGIFHYCDDPCDRYSFFSGLNVGTSFGGGTFDQEYKLGTPMKISNKTSFSGFNASGIVGFDYNISSRFTAFTMINAINYNWSKTINDINNTSNNSVYSGFSAFREARIGARFNF
jgi:hypothetical protein